MSSDALALTHGAGGDNAGVALVRRERSDDLGSAASQDKERRDSGSCDHTELESNGIVYRDATTNTPSTAEVMK